MLFLADGNIATSVVHALRNAGHDILDVKEEGWFGKTDTALIEIAHRQHRTILTHDNDFRYQSIVPVVLLRFHRQHPSTVAKHLLLFLKSSLSCKLEKPVVIILTAVNAEIHG